MLALAALLAVTAPAAPTAGDVKLVRIEAFDEKSGKSASLVTVRSSSTSALYDELPKAVDELVARSDGALPKLMHESPVVDAPGFSDRPGNGHLVVASRCSRSVWRRAPATA